jgi:hypothetical protein
MSFVLPLVSSYEIHVNGPIGKKKKKDWHNGTPHLDGSEANNKDKKGRIIEVVV